MAVFRARASSLAIVTSLAVAWASGGAFAADDVSLQQKINACHAISDRDTRIACYDRLAEPASSALPMSAPLAPSPSAVSPSVAVSKQQPAPTIASATQAPALNVAPQTASTVASAAPTPAPNVAPQPPAPPPQNAPQTSESLRSETDEIVIAISSATLLGKKLSFITSDGITWDQTDDRVIRQVPAPGDLVDISRGYLGYMCKFSKHEKFRCKPPYGLNGKMHLQ